VFIITVLIAAGYSNPALNQYIVPTTVLEWTRNILANRLANNGSQWTEIYSQFNSGTYNNQNMVRMVMMLLLMLDNEQILDYKLFTPGQPLKNGTFWLCEQVCTWVVFDCWYSVTMHNTGLIRLCRSQATSAATICPNCCRPTATSAAVR
jgi:hypothetical protein